MTAPRPVLLTGFEPFGEETVNPSQDIVRALHGSNVRGFRVESRALPCVFVESARVLLQFLDELDPEVVLCCGQAGGRSEITPERIAINLDDARIADNDGVQPVDAPIIGRGPAASWSTLPVKAIVAALIERGIPAKVSNSAGTFVCNHVFYALMHALRRRRRVLAGFVHVPFLPSQAPSGQPSLPFEQMVDGVRIALEVAVSARASARSRDQA